MMERTLVLLQKDALAKGLAGKIIARFEEAGLSIKGIKITKPSQEMAHGHYLTSDEQIVGMGNKTLAAMADRQDEIIRMFNSKDPKKIGMVLHSWLVSYITEKPVIAIVLEGEDAIKRVRAMVGNTDPAKADKGTIRGDLSGDSLAAANKEMRKVHNLVHASDSPESAKREIDVWFRPEEIAK
jgi:nucleoside-diphosphate kinase